MKKFAIVLLTFIALIVFSTTSFAQKGSFYLKKVIYGQKSEVIYHYQDGENLYLAECLPNEKYYNLKVTKNKVHYFSLGTNKEGKATYKMGKAETANPFNEKSYKSLPQFLKLFLAYHEVDQQEFQPQFNGGGQTNLNNGIPNALGPEIDASVGGSNNCTQTGSCSCVSVTITVTCSCGGVISCYERTTRVCDHDEAGREVNCRDVTGCAGRCD